MAIVTIDPRFDAQADYDDAQYTRATNDLMDAVAGMVEAGASAADIEVAVRDGLDNAGV